MSKLERPKRFLNQTARPGLRVLSLALLAVSAYAQGTVFNVSGTFDGGGDTLGGTITIGSGGILSEDLTVRTVLNVEDLGSAYTFTGPDGGSGPQSFSSGGTFYYDNAVFSGSPASELVLDIYLGTTDGFAGYTGGSLCSDVQFCGDPETFFSVGTGQQTADPNLNSGELTAATPEPSTALLLIGGGAAVLTLRRKKRRA